MIGDEYLDFDNVAGFPMTLTEVDDIVVYLMRRAEYGDMTALFLANDLNTKMGLSARRNVLKGYK